MALMTHRTTSTTTVNTTCTSTSLNPSVMPPPTYNHLDAAQRSRLIKSTRKLGKVLGTTPCVLETLPPIPALSPKISMTDIAKKRRSVPPTPTATLGEFIVSADTNPGDSRPRKMSETSTLSEGESEPFLTQAPSISSLQHRKASSDTLGPIPIFQASETGRHKPKRKQPVLRLPPMVATSAALPLPTPTPDSPSSLFSPDYKLEPTKRTDPVTAPPPVSPTSSVSPSSTEMPPTPPSGPLDPIEPTPSTAPDDALAYPGAGTLKDVETDESRLRKRRMEKLMRHLGECVPSELVFGSVRPRVTASFSGLPTSPTHESRSGGTVSGMMKDAQTRVMRRVSVISGQRKRAPLDEIDPTSSGCFSDPEPGNTGRIHSMLMRERNKIHIARGEGRVKEKPLVEDEWTPEAYEDVVRRLRRLK